MKLISLNWQRESLAIKLTKVGSNFSFKYIFVENFMISPIMKIYRKNIMLRVFNWKGLLHLIKLTLKLG